MKSLENQFKKAAGRSEGTVEVDISYDIIRHVSMQLYSNPRKAIEELICNSYDAGASSCFVKTPQDKGDFLGVLDNGVSMDFNGLRDLWKVAGSTKDKLGEDRVDNNREQIGKFGVGKLAAFSLGKRLIHVATKGGQTRIVSVGQAEIKDFKGGKKPTFEVYKLPAEKAQPIVASSLKGLPNPWEHQWKSWTLAIIGEIEEDSYGQALKLGMLKRMIRNAMPISSRFEVHLDGHLVPKRSIDTSDIIVKVDVTDEKFRNRVELALQGFWKEQLDIADSKDVPESLYKCQVGKMPSPDDVRETVPALIIARLGAIAGDAVITKKTLTTEKLAERGYRDNGFAIYSRGRQINPEDELFGITQRTHLYWRRFLAQVEIPALDKVLLVQRNSVSENRDETLVAREVLRELFNEARHRAEEKEEAGEYVPDPFGARLHMLAPIIAPLAIRELAGGKLPEGGLAAVDIDFAPLGEGGPACVYDEKTSSILVNEDHPIIVALDDRGEPAKQLRHVLGEVVAGSLVAGGYLMARGVDEGLVQDAQEIIDDAMRSAAGYLEDEVERHIREIDVASYEGRARFEKAVVRAFQDFRLSATRYGKSDEGDAILVIPQAGAENLLISVEAKGSKGVITHEELQAATIDRHREEKGCKRAIAIAREYVVSGRGGKESALLRETEGKIPLIRWVRLERAARTRVAQRSAHNRVGVPGCGRSEFPRPRHNRR